MNMRTIANPEKYELLNNYGKLHEYSDIHYTRIARMIFIINNSYNENN